MSTMAAAEAGVRVLGPGDMAAAVRLLRRRPVENVFVDYRSRLTQMDPRWMGGEMWGYYREGVLSSMLHIGANVIPVQADAEACVAFGERLITKPNQVITLVGNVEQITRLWAEIKPFWPTPRVSRWNQPHLTIDREPSVSPDPRVRRTPKRDFETLYPACVAMYTEEVESSPERNGGRALYRARVQQLIGRGWSFSRIENGRVLFKAEVACASEEACQIQGVYVDPEFRGRGLATRGMAAVVEHCRRMIAPKVGLYVNDYNMPARVAYERVGFRQTDTFATVMF